MDFRGYRSESRYLVFQCLQHTIDLPPDHNGIAGFEDWEEWFRASQRRFARALQARDTVAVLSLVFDRLYVLRNPLVHGGATWNSRVNRDQVRDGATILGCLMPVFVDVMMDNPHEDWGLPFDPAVE